MDAGRLDIEMSAMLKEQMVKVFSVMKVHHTIIYMHDHYYFKVKQLMLSSEG